MQQITIEYVGAKWCTACHILAPQIEKLCRKYGVALSKKDMDDLEEDEQIKITSLPAIRIRKAGNLVMDVSKNKFETVENWLRDAALQHNEDF